MFQLTLKLLCFSADTNSVDHMIVYQATITTSQLPSLFCIQARPELSKGDGGWPEGSLTLRGMPLSLSYRKVRNKSVIHSFYCIKERMQPKQKRVM